MPVSRTRRRTRRTPLVPLLPQAKAPPRLIQKILASWWGRSTALLAFLAAVWALVDAYGEFRPVIRLPSSSSPPPTTFRIENRNPILNMIDVSLICGVDLVVFNTDKGNVVFSIPFSSGRVTKNILADTPAYYNCDASQLAKFSNGLFCLGTLCANPGISPSSVHLAAETLQIEVYDRIFGFATSYRSYPFSWDGHTWHEAGRFNDRVCESSCPYFREHIYEHI